MQSERREAVRETLGYATSKYCTIAWDAVQYCRFDQRTETMGQYAKPVLLQRLIPRCSGSIRLMFQ